jgi:hypothetical protein
MYHTNVQVFALLDPVTMQEQASTYALAIFILGLLAAVAIFCTVSLL